MHQLSDVRGGSGILDEGVERKIRARSAYLPRDGERIPRRDDRAGTQPYLRVKVAVAALKGERTLAELAQYFKMHPKQVVLWNAQLWASWGRPQERTAVLP
jgi:hypothetical protein